MRVVLQFLLLCSFANAMAPAHPDAGESVHAHHRQLRGNHTFHQGRSGLVHAELCQGMNKAECDQLDQQFVSQARELRLQTQLTGYTRVPVICIKFTEHADRDMPARDEFDLLYNAAGSRNIFAPTGSIKSFIEYNAHGNLEVDFDVYPCIVTDNTEFFYSFGRSGITRQFGASADPVMTELENSGADFTIYDQDGDGEIDAAVIMHSGYPAEIGGRDCDTGYFPVNRIWSHAILSPSNPWTSETSGMRLGPYIVSSGLRGTCGSNIRRLGVTAHEFLHLFGLPDTNDNSGDYIGYGLGDFSVMSDPFGVNNQGDLPTSMMPYEKMEIGWIDPIEIDSDGTYSITSISQSDQVYIIRQGFPNGEYLLIENRQADSFDRQLFGGGILIYHIDESADQLKNRGYPGQEGWPGNGNHYNIALMCPDGRYDIEVGRAGGGNPGDTGDFWFGSNMEFGPGPVEQVATSNGVYPNSNTYQSGNIQQTGIRINNFSQSRPTMSFTVSGLGRAVGAPPPPGVGSGICFPGDAKMQVEGVGSIEMSRLQIGDRVLVGADKYEQVYSFGHRNEHVDTQYLRLHVSTEQWLDISKQHMVFVDGQGSIPASTVQPGDKLILADRNVAEVRVIELVQNRGAYAPFTASGTVVVNGVKASNYVAYQESETVAIAGYETGLTYQFLARTHLSYHIDAGVYMRLHVGESNT